MLNNVVLFLTSNKKYFSLKRYCIFQILRKKQSNPKKLEKPKWRRVHGTWPASWWSSSTSTCTQSTTWEASGPTLSDQDMRPTTTLCPSGSGLPTDRGPVLPRLSRNVRGSSSGTSSQFFLGFRSSITTTPPWRPSCGTSARSTPTWRPCTPSGSRSRVARCGSWSFRGKKSSFL